MNTLFGANLKKLRRERDMTQDALAAALGLSVQSISRYETNAAYPDIEMLPVIAGFFGVTTDFLLGFSPNAHKARRSEYMARFRAVKGAEAKLEVLKLWRAEFPDDWQAVYYTVAALGEIPEKKRGMDELRSLAKGALKRCTDKYWRDELIFAYLRAETDEKTAFEFIEEHGSERDIRKINLAAAYYKGRDENKTRAVSQYKQRAAISDLVHFMTVSNGANRALEGCELALDSLKKLSKNPDLTTPDMWIHDKLITLLRLSNNYFIADDKAAGFDTLNCAVALIENAVNLPDGTKLSHGSPKFDMLDAGVEKGVSVYGGHGYLHIFDSLAINMKYENLPFESGEKPIASPVFFPSHFRPIIAYPRWRGFKKYENAAEYQKCAERVKKESDITEKKNAEYILTRGVVRNPDGGRLCAVKTVNRENVNLLYVLFEEPKNGFSKALEQFGESARLCGIRVSEPILTVDGEGKAVETPEEIINFTETLPT